MPLDNEIMAAALERLHLRAQAQRLEGWWPRKEKLCALRRAFVATRQELQDAISADLGRAHTETDVIEYLPVLGEVDNAIANVRRWCRPQRQSASLAFLGTRSEIIPQPKGVCLILAPWNYPVSLMLGPLVSCIAAGNAAVLKPSEFAPATCHYLQELTASVFGSDEVIVVEGGPETAEALLAQPFNHIFFTGSPAIGRIVMEAAAKGPTSVTLELGGKSPAFVHESADIDNAVRKLVWGKFVNAGQTCIAPDYLLAEANIADELKAALIRRIREVYPAETAAGRRGSDFAAIVTPHHTQRLLDMIEDAREKGANILIGGTVDAASRFVAPTLMDNISSDMRVTREEIFGPILPVLTVPNLENGIAHVNAGPPPLASYIFARDKRAANRFITEVPAGGSCVNNALIHFGNEKLPFGGIGQSGIGRSHGKAGFEAFSNMRAVMRDRFSLTHLFFPPYTAAVKARVSAFLRIRRGA